MLSRVGVRSVLIFLTFAWAACNGSPAAPRSVVVKLPNFNTPPVIKSVTTTASTVIRNEVEQDVTVTAVVEDKETPVANLTYLWSANVGTVTGTGPIVTWKLARGAVQTPVDVTISLTVVEPYVDVDSVGNPVPKENRVTQSAAPFHVHDSMTELKKMAIDFLVVYFGNSNVSAKDALVDFSNSCPGKCDEWVDITNNRLNFRILSADAHVSSLVFDDANHATILAPTSIVNIVLATGQVESSSFIGLLTAIFENGRWWLCDSNALAADAMPITEFLVRRSFSGGGSPVPRSVDKTDCPFVIGQHASLVKPPSAAATMTHGFVRR